MSSSSRLFYSTMTSSMMSFPSRIFCSTMTHSDSLMEGSGIFCSTMMSLLMSLWCHYSTFQNVLLHNDVIAPSFTCILFFYWVWPNILIGPPYFLLFVNLGYFPTQNVYKESPFSPKKIWSPICSNLPLRYFTCKVSPFEVRQVQGKEFPWDYKFLTLETYLVL